MRRTGAASRAPTEAVNALVSRAEGANSFTFAFACAALANTRAAELADVAPSNTASAPLWLELTVIAEPAAVLTACAIAFPYGEPSSVTYRFLTPSVCISCTWALASSEVFGTTRAKVRP